MIKSSELPLNPNGSIYHLNIKPGDLADKIILVGDPGRVDRVAAHLEEITFQREKREFRSLTGRYRGQEMTVLSTGIGTDNIDIVINELDALVNIDFSTREIHDPLRSLQIMRLGTCGSLQPDIPVGSLVFSEFALGGDVLGHYYQKDEDPERRRLEGSIQAFMESKAPEVPAFYAAHSDADLIGLIRKTFPEILSGITFTAGGFYGPQGRSLGRITTIEPRLPEILAEFEFGDFRVTNMEMEAAAIGALGQSLGHRTGTLCVALANRPKGEFAQNPGELVEKLIETGLEVMHAWS